MDLAAEFSGAKGGIGAVDTPKFRSAEVTLALIGRRGRKTSPRNSSGACRFSSFSIGASLLLRPLVYENLVQLRDRFELLFGARIEVLRPEAFEAAEKAELRRRVAVDAKNSHQFVLVKSIQEE